MCYFDTFLEDCNMSAIFIMLHNYRTILFVFIILCIRHCILHIAPHMKFTLALILLQDSL